MPVTRAEREDGAGLRRPALVLAWTAALALFVAVVALWQPGDLLAVAGALLLIVLPAVALPAAAGAARGRLTGPGAEGRSER